MKHRIVVGTAILAAGLLAQLALVPSSSASSTPPANCNGPSCTAALAQFIKYYGDVGQNGGDLGTLGTASTPLLCLWEDYGNQKSGSQAIIDISRILHNVYEPPYSEEMQQEIKNAVNLAYQLLDGDNKETGTWYFIYPNGSDTTQQADTCAQYDLFQFVQTGAAPAELPAVPPAFLAVYAFNHMLLPKPKLVISPAVQSVVNLATFVWTTWPRQLADTAAQYIYAVLGDQVVTVWAQPQSVNITVTGPGLAYSDSCSVSDSVPAKAPVTGAGVPPNCGVLWTGTDQDATISATITWRVTYYTGLPHGPGGTVVPGTANGFVYTTGVHGDIRVISIQSINTG